METKNRPKIVIKRIQEKTLEEHSIAILNEGLQKDLAKTEGLIKTSQYTTLEEEFTRRILEEIDDRIIACEETDIDKKLLTRVKHNYYELKDIMLRQRSKQLESLLDKVENKISESETNNLERMNEIKEKIDNIGYNVLSMIISFSIGTALITAIDKIDALYIPIFVIGTIWLVMTLMVFVNGLFNKNDHNSKQSTFIYAIFSVLTLIALGYTFYFSEVRKCTTITCCNIIDNPSQKSE